MVNLVKILIFICTLFSKVFTFYISDEINHKNKTLTNFVFGSCYKGFLGKRDDIFKTIIKESPEIFVWLGDANYLDYPLNFLRPDFGFDEIRVISKFNETKQDICNLFIII
jgi:hypothetical protein